MDHGGLSWIMNYHGLPWLNGASWTSGLLWHIVDYRGFLNMHHKGIAWITAHQSSDDTYKVWRRYGAYHSLRRPCASLLLLWIIVDCYGLSTIMDYHGLSWIILDYR